jgi:hypothetical protein
MVIKTYLKIPNGYLECANRRTDNIIAKGIKTKIQTKEWKHFSYRSHSTVCVDGPFKDKKCLKIPKGG